MAKPERESVSKTHCKKSKEKPCLHKTKEKMLVSSFMEIAGYPE